MELRGAARLLHIEAAMALKGGRDPTEQFRVPAASVASNQISSLPTEEELARTLVEDPYGWIHAHSQADLPPLPGHQEGQAAREPLRYRSWYQRDSAAAQDAVALKMVRGSWAEVADCGRDDLHIPRRLTWAVLPRSRECTQRGDRTLWMPPLSPLPPLRAARPCQPVLKRARRALAWRVACWLGGPDMNMEMPFAELSRKYLLAARSEREAIAPVPKSVPEYGEGFLARYRAHSRLANRPKQGLLRGDSQGVEEVEASGEEWEEEGAGEEGQ